ncbi:hypothetical protein COSHB9_04960 [Companilactobacillus alimentarius]|nr:hypothetical protein LAL01_18230 [Companilactobacillus alimentarius]
MQAPRMKTIICKKSSIKITSFKITGKLWITFWRCYVDMAFYRWYSSRRAFIGSNISLFI